jgi:tetratricopeptide (TPR) repeat protein
MPSIHSPRRSSALLWLALALGASGVPVRAEVQLAAPVEDIRTRLRDGQLDAAIKAGEAAVETLAQDSQAWLWLGRAYGRQAMEASLITKAKWAGRTRDAFEKAVELDADNHDARFDLMQYYVMAPGFMGGGRDKADAQATELRRRDAVMGKLADATLADVDEQPSQAEQAMRDALKLDPSSDRARVTLSSRMQRQERWGESRALWQERLAAAPDDALAHYQLGRLAAVSGEELDAGLVHIEAYLRSGVVSEYVMPAGAHWRRGQLLEKLGRRDDALQAYREALRLQPSLEPAQADLDRLADA